MKAPSPAFSFYPKDIESDENCKAMTHAEFGMYVRLLCNCWTEGSIPADPVRLQRILGVSHKTFKAAWPAIAPCFSESGNRLVQLRLEKERAKQLERSIANSERGRKGGRPAKSTVGKKPELSDRKSGEKPDKSLPSPSPSPSPSSSSSPSPSPSSSPSPSPGNTNPDPREDHGRAVSQLLTVSQPLNGSPPKFDVEKPKNGSQRLHWRDVGIQVDPSQFACLELAWAVTRVVEATGVTPYLRKNKAAELIGDASETPNKKARLGLDLRKASPEWAKVTADRVLEIGREVYGIPEGELVR